MARGERVVGVVDRDQPRGRRAPGEGVLDVLRPPARRVEEEGDHRPALIGHHLARGQGHRPVGGRGLSGDPGVELGAGVGVDVEARVGGGGDRVGPGGHGLGLELGDRPRGVALGRHHPPGVVVDPDRVDHVEPPAGGRSQLERAPVAPVAPSVLGPALEGQGGPGGRGGDDRRADGGDYAMGAGDADPSPSGQARPVDVAGGGRPARHSGSAREGHAPDRVGHQDADEAAGWGGSDRGTRVVVAEDRPVVGAVEGEAVGAILAHAHPVSAPAPVDQEHRCGARPGREPEDAGQARCQETAHRREAS